MPRDEIGPTEWYFIASPLKVSWSKKGEMSETLTYGSNSAHLTYGTTKLRALTLNECLIEGFTDNKTVENNVRELEECMHIHIDSESGSAAPYCWRLFAGSKSYGTYVLTSVESNEIFRDNSGNSTRSVVNLTMQEVADYQVNLGQDLAAPAITARFPADYENRLQQAKRNQDAIVGAGGEGESANNSESENQKIKVEANPSEDVGDYKDTSSFRLIPLGNGQVTQIPVTTKSPGSAVLG